MMSLNMAVIVLYAFSWLARIYACTRRGRRPLAGGPEWFFDVRVRRGFYEGEGRAILHRYWFRMLLPFAIEIPLAATIFFSGRIWLLNVLIVFGVAFASVHDSMSAHTAEQRARAFVEDVEARTTRIALSLTPRRLRDFTNWKIESVIVLAHGVALFWLVRHYLVMPNPDARLVFTGPAFLVYVQIGMLFVKKLIISERSAVADVNATERWRAEDDARQFFLAVCDWGRGILAAAILFAPLKLATAQSRVNQLVVTWLLALVIVAALSCIWMAKEQGRLQARRRRGRPMLPDFLGQNENAGRLLCYRPNAPMLILKGTRGYSVNLANHLAQIAAVYLAGLIALFAMLRLPT